MCEKSRFQKEENSRVHHAATKQQWREETGVYLCKWLHSASLPPLWHRELPWLQERPETLQWMISNKILVSLIVQNHERSLATGRKNISVKRFFLL